MCFSWINEEPQRGYVMKATAAAASEIEIARIIEVLTKTATAWRCFEDATIVNLSKQWPRDNTGSAPAQQLPKSCRPPRPGRWESITTFSGRLHWHQDKMRSTPTRWTVKSLD